jgi:hypothetical protein
MMKPIVYTSLFLLLFSAYCAAQSVEYVYDSAGNRTLRRIIVMSSSQSEQLRSEKEEDTNPEENEVQPAEADVIAGLTVSIYPNPTRGLLVVEVQGGEQDKLPLALYDSLGKQLINRQIGRGYNRLDLSTCLAGWYILCIGDREYKIIKQ